MARDGSARQRIDAEPGAQRRLVPVSHRTAHRGRPIDNVPRARIPVLAGEDMTEIHLASGEADPPAAVTMIVWS